MYARRVAIQSERYQFWELIQQFVFVSTAPMESVERKMEMILSAAAHDSRKMEP